MILNIEEDHLDFFKDLEDIRHSFHQFAELLPEDGTLVINGDIKDYEKIFSGLNCNVVTYGSLAALITVPTISLMMKKAMFHST